MKCSLCNHEGADLLGCEGNMEHIRPQRCMKNHGDDIAELRRRVETLEAGWMKGGVFVYPSTADKGDQPMTPETPCRSPKEKPEVGRIYCIRSGDVVSSGFTGTNSKVPSCADAWAYVDGLLTMPVRPEPVQRKCGRCGESFSAGRPEGCHGFHEHPEVCAKSLHRQIQSVAARAEKAEAERDEARADVSRLGQLLEAERGELKKIVDAGRDFMKRRRRSELCSDLVQLFDALRPHMQQEGG